MLSVPHFGSGSPHVVQHTIELVKEEIFEGCIPYRVISTEFNVRHFTPSSAHMIPHMLNSERGY